MRSSKLLLAASILAMLFAGTAMADDNKGNVDELRFGSEVDASGEVAPNTSKDHFLAGTTIHVTMQVQEAPEGTPLLINILDRETEELAWSDEKPIPMGHSIMHFIIAPGDLNPGKYRARVRIGGDWVAEHEFKVEAE